MSQKFDCAWRQRFSLEREGGLKILLNIHSVFMHSHSSENRSCQDECVMHALLLMSILRAKFLAKITITYPADLREISASYLVRLMINIKTAHRKLTVNYSAWHFRRRPRMGNWSHPEPYTNWRIGWALYFVLNTASQE